MMMLNAVLMAGECFFGGTLILLMAMLLARGKAASQRHLFLTGGFAVLLILPLALMLVPSQMVWQIAQMPLPAAAAPTVEAAPQQAPLFDLATLILGLVAFWAMGVIFLLTKAAFGAVALIDLYRNSVPHIPDGIDGGDFRGLSWQLRIRTIPGEAGPITFGLLKPVVLLPKTSVTWPRARLKAVLLHEAAHVRRKDCLARLIAVMACALYWPNPLVWMAARAMRRHGETAADDCVLSSGFKASAYAEHLVGLARAFSYPAYGGVSLAMAEPAMLDARIEAILNPARSRRAVTRMDVLKIAALGLVATAVIALIRPALADDGTTKKQIAQADLIPEIQLGNVVISSQQIIADKISLDNKSIKAGKKRITVEHDSVDPGAVIVHMADADDAALPPIPPKAPVAPLAPVSADAPKAPVALAAPVPAPMPHNGHVIRVTETDKDGNEKVSTFNIKSLNAQLRAELKRTLEDAKVQQSEAARIQAEEIRKAIAAAHVQEKVAMALKSHAADIKQAQADAGAAVAKAIADVNIPKIIAQAMAKVGPAIDEALANQGKRRHVEVIYETGGLQRQHG